jgi:outer membrane protein
MRALPVLVLLCSACAAASAQEPEILTLPQAVSLALHQNRTVRTAELETRRFAERIAIERTRLLPALSTWALGGQLLTRPSIRFDPGVFGAYASTGPIPATATDVTTGRVPAGAVVAQATLPLTERVRIHLTIQGLQMEERFSRETERERRHAISNDVTRTYYTLLQTESQLASAEQSVTLYREALRLTEDNLRQETVLAGDLLEVKGRLARAELQSLQLRNGLDTAREQLNELMGRDIAAAFRTDPAPEDDAAVGDVAEARRKAIAARPELAQARIRLQEASLERRSKKAEYLPNVSLAVDYFSTLHLNSLVPANFAVAGVQISWEPFDWGRKRHETGEKQRVEDEASLALQETESRILRDVGAQFRKLEESRRQLAVSRLGQQSAEENLRVMKNKYGLEAALLKDLLQAEALLAEAGSQYRQSLGLFWTARADFERAVGEDR